MPVAANVSRPNKSFQKDHEKTAPQHQQKGLIGSFLNMVGMGSKDNEANESGVDGGGVDEGAGSCPRHRFLSLQLVFSANIVWDMCTQCP
jgi:hypothetical protein